MIWLVHFLLHDKLQRVDQKALKMYGFNEESPEITKFSIPIDNYAKSLPLQTRFCITLLNQENKALISNLTFITFINIIELCYLSMK